MTFLCKMGVLHVRTGQRVLSLVFSTCFIACLFIFQETAYLIHFRGRKTLYCNIFSLVSVQINQNSAFPSQIL